MDGRVKGRLAGLRLAVAYIGAGMVTKQKDNQFNELWSCYELS